MSNDKNGRCIAEGELKQFNFEQSSTESPRYEQHGWFIFVGDSVREYRLIYDYADVVKDELEASGLCDVTIKKALVEVCT